MSDKARAGFFCARVPHNKYGIYWEIKEYPAQGEQSGCGGGRLADRAQNGVLKGTLILIVGNLIVKIIGALFKLPLANLIGADGMGLYNASFTVYDIFLVLATAGFPLAVSKLVSASCARGDGEEALKIFRVSRACFWVIGIVFSVLMFTGAELYAHWIANTRAVLSIRILSPAILFVSLMSAYRGYYQGINDMIPTTVSQITEAVCRLAVGLSAAWALGHAGCPPEVVAAGAILGITAGEFVSTFTLAMLHHRRMRRHKPPVRRRRGLRAQMPAAQIVSAMFATSLPIGVGAIIISAVNTVDSAVLMHRLADIGYTEREANMLYGTFNMAFTVFSLPVTVVSALIVSVFPVLSYAHAAGQTARVRRTARASLRVTVLAGTASAALFLSLSYPLVMLLYFRQPQAARVAAALLTLQGPAAIPFTLFMISTCILQAVDRLFVPTVSSIIGGVCGVVCNWFLIGQKSIGIFGAPVGIVVCYTVAALINLAILGRQKQLDFAVGAMVCHAMLPAAAMGLTGYAVFRLTLPVLGLFGAAGVSLALALPVYLLALFFSRTLERDDLLLLPRGQRIVGMCERMRLLHPSEKEEAPPASKRAARRVT